MAGPTSSGKSGLAVRLAKKFDGEVISADSRQVYKGLDIGTGKITKREMRGIPHHLLDVVSPRSKLNAHDFVVRARKAVDDIVARGKVPIIAGGTGFYIDALVGNSPLPNIAANEKLREKFEKKTIKQLFALLKKKDPKRAKTIQSDNKRRLIRALEIVDKLGSVPQQKSKANYEVLWIGIKPEREKLRERIHGRLITRLKQGMIAEAKRLHEKGLSYKRMEELGLEYRYLARFLKKQITKEEMIEQLSAKIWQYARRQMTYWRRNKNIQWIKPEQMKKTGSIVKKFLNA